MTTKELKIEIEKAINELPEDLLLEILNLLKDIKNISRSELELSKNLTKILSEDKELLFRLAK
jgi:hypothetical protein